MRKRNETMMGDYAGKADSPASDRAAAGPMRQFFRPSRKKIVIAVVIPLLSLFFFLLLFGAPPIGLRLCGGCVEEDGQVICYDYFCIEGPYTVSIILSHVVSAYVFVCYSGWAWNKTRGIEPRRKKAAVGAIYVLSWPLLLMFLPFVLLLTISVIRPDYCPSMFCQFPLPLWVTI